MLQVVDKLHGILKPFLLRRVKSDVENSLPGKKELILYANMTKTQTDFNEELRKNTLNVSRHTFSHYVELGSMRKLIPHANNVNTGRRYWRQTLAC